MELSFAVTQTYVNQSPTDILVDILDPQNGIPLSYSNSYPVNYQIDLLSYVGYRLFYAIDLLAKLSGNYLWDIGWDQTFRFRPNTLPADHILYLDQRKLNIKVWKSSEWVKNFFELFGGVVNENEYFRSFSDQASIDRYGSFRQSLFARAITTDEAYEYLRQAVLEQMPQPVFEKYIDVLDQDVSIQYGDTLQLRNTGLQGFDETQLYRVKREEIKVDPEGQIELRYHLADLWESSSRYLRYLDHQPVESAGDYVRRRTGSFQLDFSVLDSPAHLD